MAADGSRHRFRCTPGGAVAQGRRRLKALLLALAALAAGAAAAAWSLGRPWPGVLALAVASLPLLAWRLAGDLEPLWLEVREGELVLQLRQRRERLPLAGARARRLTAAEIAHLHRLVTAGWIAAGSGGFDSHLLGEFHLYASDLTNAVLVETEEARLVLTPDRPEAFLGALGGARRPGPPAAPGEA